MSDSNQTRQAFVRRCVASLAGVGLVAAVLALLAVPNSGGPAAVHLPSAAAANAAFAEGLKATPAARTANTSGTPVAIKNYAFTPASLTIAAGTKVTWTNEDTAPHTVTVLTGPVKFASPTLHTGDSFTYTFTTPGTYSYYCAVHPDMTAKIVVTGTASSAPTTAAPKPSRTASPSMSMPSPAPDPQTCAVSTALQTFLSHVNSAHLDESPGQQVHDMLNVDRYLGNHLVLVQTMLNPITAGGASSALSGLVSTLITHINTAHLDESLSQQAHDLADINSYIGNHLALVQHMLAGTEALAC